MANPWVRSWPVVGTSGKEYKVSQRQDGTFGCDCPAWMMQRKEKWINGVRQDCQHILKKKMELMQQEGRRTPSKPVAPAVKKDQHEIVRAITLED